MTDNDEQLEARLRARPLPGLTDEATHRLLADLASVTTDSTATPPEDLAATPSLKKRRWIVRHPVSSAAAATIFVLAIVGVGLWFYSGAATPAYADFLQPLLDAKTVKYKMIIQATSLPAGTTGLSPERQKELLKPYTSLVMELGSDHRRQESETPAKMVEIWDGNQHKQLVLEPARKRATLYDYSEETDDKKHEAKKQGSPSPRHRPGEPGSVALFRSLLLDTVHKPDAQREPLGKKMIDGRRVVGFRLSTRGVVLNVWGDPKTRLPVRIESTMTLMPNLEVTASNFEFNVPMDESLFSLEPPAGYELVIEDRQPSDDSPAKEKDLIEMFRNCGLWNGGRFPDLLDTQWLQKAVHDADWLEANLDLVKPEVIRNRQLRESQRKINRGMRFAALLPKESDRHYAGRGVSIGEPDTPVLWYRPKDAEKYRVIYADLSVQEAGVPPRVPAVPFIQMENDLIEMFRQYAELSGGLFPDKLDKASILSYGMVKSLQEPGAREKQEIAKVRVNLQRGLMYIGLLPKEADIHYAGKHAGLDMAQRPIFWYRPKATGPYRVVYGDLSVRDADTPPSMPVALPKPGRPQGHCSIAGTVVAEATGKPVPNACVFLFYYPTSHGMFINTDDDGSFAFNSIRTGPYSLQTSGTPGYQDARYDPEHKDDMLRQFSLKNGEQRSDIVLKVKQACRISGKVVDQDGKVPEDAAQLTVNAWFEADDFDGYQNKGAGVNRSDGSYMIDGLSHKPAFVTVENRRAAQQGHGPPLVYSPGTFFRSEARLVTFEKDRTVENVNITRPKERGLSIDGTVRDEAGTPVPEAFVVVHPRDMHGGLMAAYTDPDGHYQIRGLGEGEFLVHVDAVHRRLVRTRKPVHLDKTTTKTELDFTLHRGVTISGKLVDENGRDWKVDGNTGLATVDPSEEKEGFIPTSVDFRNKYRPKNFNGMGCGTFYLGDGDYTDGEMVFPTTSTFIAQGVMPGHTTFQFTPQKITKILHAGQDILNSGIDTKPGQEIKDVTIVIGAQ